MKKRISGLLILPLALMIAACGNNTRENETDSMVQNMGRAYDSSFETEPEEVSNIEETEQERELSSIKESESERESGSAEKAEQEEVSDIEQTELEREPGSAEEAEPKEEGNSIAESEESIVEANKIYIQVGENTLTAVLEDNESAKALRELLADGPLTISASNYGGFEKVCSLGAELPRNDSQTTTHAGDICLYSGNQIVIFYGSNSWAYTRLGRVSNADASELKTILSGEETEITISG